MLGMEVDKRGTRKGTSSVKPYNRRGAYNPYQKPPGKVVGVIAQQPKGYQPGDYNPLVLFWTVSPYRTREDFNKVVEQSEKGTQLSGYPQELLNSCIKGWD